MNNVVLIGRLTKAPELRYIPETQNAVATFTIAVDRQSKDKGADYPKITVFGKQAENCERFTGKGKLVAVQGEIHTGSYKNKNGDTVYTTEVVANRVQFLEWAEKFQAEDENQDVKYEKKQGKKPSKLPDGFYEDSRPGFDELSDDIPF